MLMAPSPPFCFTSRVPFLSNGGVSECTCPLRLKILAGDFQMPAVEPPACSGTCASPFPLNSSSDAV